jgi:hypothetical protein
VDAVMHARVRATEGLSVPTATGGT